MSQENVEVVRRWNAAFNERDWETFAALMDAKVEYDATLIDSRTTVGRDEVVTQLRRAEAEQETLVFAGAFGCAQGDSNSRACRDTWYRRVQVSAR